MVTNITRSVGFVFDLWPKNSAHSLVTNFIERTKDLSLFYKFEEGSVIGPASDDKCGEPPKWFRENKLRAMVVILLHTPVSKTSQNSKNMGDIRVGRVDVDGSLEAVDLDMTLTQKKFEYVKDLDLKSDPHSKRFKRINIIFCIR